MTAMPHAGPMSMAVPDMTPARHGDATFRTDLSPLPTHARRDFRLVWNEIGTKPHRIGRAGLADIDTLGTGFIQTAEQCADRQRQPADKMYCSHSFLLRSQEALSRREEGRLCKRALASVMNCWTD